jgi:DNA (cytosine-5)-methyltransferase 1
VIYGSVCSGIEAASVAWSPLGWRCAFVSEVEAFPCALLKHYYPGVPNLGDLNNYEQWPRQSIDVLVGGTPCQDFSVAGQRAGLGGARGGLTMRFLDCVERFAPAWVVWENVPGVLSIDGGRAFGAFLGGLAKRGYGFAYRVLDAQYFGLAQRRERVFVVGCAGGKWQRAAAVLFDAPGLRWNPPPSREAKQRVAPTVEGRAGRSGCNNFATSGGLYEVASAIRANSIGGGRAGDSRGQDCVVPVISGTIRSGSDSPAAHNKVNGTDRETLIASAITDRNSGAHGVTKRGDGSQCLIAHSLTAEGHDASEDGTGRGVPLVAGTIRERKGGGTTTELDGHGAYIPHGMAVRRLTPREVERLQGFPDDYTLVPYRGKPACDGPRYRALGNSFAVPVVRWIGERIEKVSQP